jgi:hypothetical protein
MSRIFVVSGVNFTVIIQNPFSTYGACSDKYIDDGDQENSHNNVIAESVGLLTL